MGLVVTKAKDIQQKILNKSYVDYLCDDVWVKIFSFLKVKQFCRISVICTYFRNITHYTNHGIQHHWKCRCMKRFPSIFAKLKLQDTSLNHWHKLFAEIQRLTNMLETEQRYQQYPFYIQLCLSDSINSIKLMDNYPDSTYLSQTQHAMSKFERTYQDEFCETASQFAVSHHSCNIVKYYLDDPALKLSWKECGVLMQLCLNQENTWKESDILSIMSILKMILKNSNCNQQSVNYESPNQFYKRSSFMLACQGGHYQAVPLLLRHGANVCGNETCTTPFYQAIRCLELHLSSNEGDLWSCKYRDEYINIISVWTHIINHKDFDLSNDVAKECTPPLFQIVTLKYRSCSAVDKVMYIFVCTYMCSVFVCF